MLIDAKPIFKKLEELRDERKCGCSDQKARERVYFDIVLADVRLMADDAGMIDPEKAVSELERTRSQIRIGSRDLKTKYQVYEYAIRVIRSAEHAQTTG